MNSLIEAPLAITGGPLDFATPGAACGRSGSSSSATTAQAVELSSANTITTAVALASPVSRVMAEIAKYLAKPIFIALRPSIDATGLKGKTALFVEHDTVANSLVWIAKRIQAAWQTIGVSVETYNSCQATVSTNAYRVQQGINQKVGAVVLDGAAISLM